MWLWLWACAPGSRAPSVDEPVAIAETTVPALSVQFEPAQPLWGYDDVLCEVDEATAEYYWEADGLDG